MLLLPSLRFPCFHNDQSPPPRNISLQKNFRSLLKKPLGALPLVVLLASCGGGSGGSTGPVSGGSGGSDPLPPSGPAPARISQARPRPGSVTQSSDTENGITTDKIQIIPGQNGNFSLMNNNKLMVEDNRGLLKYHPYSSVAWSGIKERRYRNNYVYDWGSQNNDRSVYGKIDNNITSFGVDMKTQYRGRTENSYLALRWWAERKPGGSLSLEGLFEGDLGVFVDGSDEYTDSISPLTGTAYYYGSIKLLKYNTNSDYYRDMCGTSCTGFRVHGADTEAEARHLIDSHNKYNDGLAFGEEMYGDINLTADFGDGNSLGHIEGVINEIESSKISGITRQSTSSGTTYALDFHRVTLPGSLNLERATIGETNSGFFDGTVSGELNGRDYTGKWGGQFYGINYPNTVAGTMAASSGDFHLMAPWSAGIPPSVPLGSTKR